MPKIFEWNGYVFYFYSHEAGKPPHVHIDKDNKSAKFWLSPVKLASSIRFRDNELRALERKTHEQQHLLLEAWYAYFKNHH